MSKKDLLERLNRPADGSVRRPDGTAGRTRDDAVTTRVNGKVVRRRRRDEGEGEGQGPELEADAVESAPESTPERREPAPVEAEARPATPERRAPAPVEAAPTPVERAAPPLVEAPAPVTQPAAVQPAAVQPPAAVVTPPAAAVTPPAPVAATPAPTPVEAPRAAAPERPAPAAATPEPAAATPPAPDRRPAPDTRRPAPDARRPGTDSRGPQPPNARPSRRERGEEFGGEGNPSAPEQAPVAAAPEHVREEMQLPQQAKFVGLGKAVVMPPPGYDPTNPHAWRREQQPAGGDPNSPARGRRRVEAGPAGRPVAPAERDRRRASPSGPASPGGPGGGGGGPGPSGRPSNRQQPFDARMRRKPRRKRVVGPKASSPAPRASKRKVRVDHVISVRDLAKQLQIKASMVIKTLMDLGQMATITEMLDIESASLVANEFEYEVDNVGFQEDEFLQHVGGEEEEEGMVPRPPVVTIMGHVDHGKTTLLDAIRSSRVAKGEAGGITQHIGAYEVPIGDSTITFLDTPGHEAFSSMRARGASVTDIVVLVVAADDGVQPQTAEAISHAQAAGVPIIVAVNKMDKPGVNPDSVKQQLTEYHLVPEEWGGETLFVPVSALRGEGIEGLLEAIHLQAEILDLRANPERHAEGVVIEAQMERGRGAVATVLIQQGTLSQGDYVVLGSAFGRVRAMVDHRGKRLKTAGPSTPVELFGLSDLPEVGDDLAVVTNEKNARTLAEHRGEHKRLISMSEHRRSTAEDIFAAAAKGSMERLHIVLKADVQGTLQALKAALEKIEVAGTEVKVLLAAVGDISESDVNLAASDTAVLLGFNVKLDAKARQAADSKGVEPELYDVIYGLLDSVKARLKGMLAPEYRQVLNGKAEIRALFHISKVGTVAGCYVTEGVIGRQDAMKVTRNGKVVHEGTLRQLKRFKDDVREVRSGFECGMSLDGFNDILEGDVLEAYRSEQVERT